MTYQCGGQGDVTFGRSESIRKPVQLSGKEYEILSYLDSKRKRSVTFSVVGGRTEIQPYFRNKGKTKKALDSLEEKGLVSTNDRATLSYYFKHYFWNTNSRQALNDIRLDAAEQMGFAKPEETLQYW